MTTLREIFHQAPKLFFSQEGLVNINILINLISNSSELILVPGLLLPFYVGEERKRYELYQYELIINGFEEKEFEEFILKRTSKSTIEEIDKKIIKILSYCFIKIQMMEDDKTNFFRYIDFLKNEADLRKEMVEIFGEFSPTNIYFDFY
ncbi:hypothetical protein BN1356_01099 [Streptococcus varani]|uniref:Uncharacterized protein n=1 Tax=Streptococcus varani TaxID=1608583 RepID=A0A0E4H4P9_9STRE|nr:hypothetical protein [Streptococcus varani]CQR24743.1 hypothetical protein BN1356_01099 [Streptococcus varani]